MFLMRIVRSLDFARDDRETPGDDRMNDSAGSGLKTSLTRSSGKKSAQPIAGFKKMRTFAAAKRVSPIRPAPCESSRA